MTTENLDKLHKHIVLLGYMGCGKSLIGKSIANVLAIPFTDLDEYIEEKEQQTIAQIFESKGEIYFRKREKHYLKELLSDSNPRVISLGGGTPCYFDNMKEILAATQQVIYLKTSVSTLAERLISETAKRPILQYHQTKTDLETFIAKHLFERQSFYFEAPILVTTDGKTPEKVVQEILESLKNQDR
jgi:shikimate kinase